MGGKDKEPRPEPEPVYAEPTLEGLELLV